MGDSRTRKILSASITPTVECLHALEMIAAVALPTAGHAARDEIERRAGGGAEGLALGEPPLVVVPTVPAAAEPAGVAMKASR